MSVSRHFARIVLMQSIFQWEFNNGKKYLTKYLDDNVRECNLSQEGVDFATELLTNIEEENFQNICGYIDRFAPECYL